MRKAEPNVHGLLDKLEKHYGKQRPGWPVDPYEFIVWWNCRYPASDVACAKGWKKLKSEVGTDPPSSLAATSRKIASAVKAGGLIAPGLPYEERGNPAVLGHKKTSLELIDVLDRVLDKGIVIDVSIRIALAGIDLVRIHARIVVASIETYLERVEALAVTDLLAETPLALAHSVPTAETATIVHHAHRLRSKRRTA